MTPGQRITHGTRQPPSQFVSFSPRNGVAPPSGHDALFGAVVRGEDDDRIVSHAEIVDLLQQVTDVAIELDHPVRVQAVPGLAH